MDTLEIKIFLPFIRAFVIDDDFVRQHMKEGIIELLDLHEKFEVSLLDLGKFKVQIEMIAGYSNEPVVESAMLFKVIVPNSFDKLWDEFLEKNPKHPIPKQLEKMFMKNQLEMHSLMKFFTC